MREAVDRTLQATAGSRERATELLDEVAKRGRGAGGDIARAGQLAGADLARRGQEAGAGLSRRLELLERRLAEVEDSLRREAGDEPDGGDGGDTGTTATGVDGPD